MSGGAESLTQAVQRWLGIGALFVAPTSLITGLCYFFGLVYLRQRLAYFGIDPSTLDLTTADYVVAVVKTFFFVALRVLAVLGLVLAMAVTVRHWVQSGRRIRLLRGSAWGVLALGAVSLGNSLCWLVFGTLPVQWVVEDADATYTAASIVVGCALLAAGYLTLKISAGADIAERALSRTAERSLLAIATAMIIAALFWMTDIYAADLGRRDAEFDATHLWSTEGSVQLDTTEVLMPPSDLVRASVLPADAGSNARIYRYECLRVLEVRKGRYVLVPAKWNRENGWAMTVTPDSTHRINAVLHDGLANHTGGGANVRNFWQCPEVARFYRETDLDGLLVGPEVMRTILGSQLLNAGAVDVTMPNPTGDTSSTSSCALQANPEAPASAMPSYPSEGAATRRIEMTGRELGERVWAQERVTTFPSPASAAAFVAETRQRWGLCAGKVAMVMRSGTAEPRALSSPGEQENILAVADSPVGSSIDDCAIAVGAKSNVLIHVDVCGADQPLLALGVVAAITRQIPN